MLYSKLSKDYKIFGILQCRQSFFALVYPTIQVVPLSVLKYLVTLGNYQDPNHHLPIYALLQLA